jgi:RNA exonuclease NGL2
METIKPFLEASGYDMVYACGPRKKHGSLIAFRKEKFELVKAIVVPLDTVERGASHKTKNIGNLVGIRERDIRDRGYIVATSHLFWHPSYVQAT